MKNRRTFASLLFATLLLAFAAPRAEAEFRVCNQTGKGLNVAYSVYYLRGETPKYESRGWKVLEDKQCSDVDRSGYRRVWLLGMGHDGTMWEGAEDKNSRIRTFCQKTDNRFFFDDGAIADVHSSARICEENGGTLKQFREFFGQVNLYTITFEPGPNTGRPDTGAGKPTRPPIWETYPDEAKPSTARPAPTPTFAPD